MNKKIKMVFTFCMAIMITAVFSTENAWSDTKKPSKANTKIQKKNAPTATNTMQLPKRSNPYPNGIYAYECPCKRSVESTGAILMKGVMVRLTNKKCPPALKPMPVSGKVKFTWYDLVDKRFKSVTKSFTNLRKSLIVVMIPATQTILASKSKLVKAEIIEINGATDCDIVHNWNQYGQCLLEPVY